MKQKLLNKLWLRVGMIVAIMTTALSGTVWAEDVVVTLDNIGAGLTSTANTTAATTSITATGTTDSYTLNYYQCKKQGNAMFMTKSVAPYISNKTAMPGNIKSVEVFINSGASGKTTYDCAFSTTELNTATSGVGAQNITGGNSHTFTNSSAQGKYFCITLGNANNGQVLKLVVTCEKEGGTPTPSISASDVNIAYNATNGSIAYTLSNATGNVTASVTEGDWLTLGTITSSAVSFTCSENLGKTARTATVKLSYTDASDKVVNVTQAGNPNIVDNVSDITAVNTSYKVKGTVVATNSRGFVIGDGTGYVYTYLNSAPSQNVGDKVTISGTTGSYGHILQFTSSATITEANTSNYDNTPAITVVDASAISAYAEDYQLSDYVQFEGTLTSSVSGNYTNYNISVGNATARISYPTDAQATALNNLINNVVRVKGYFAGFSSSTFTVMMESVEEVVTPVINANDVELAYNATSGEIAYTIANPTGATLTATTSADWISNIIVSSDKVTFTATANEGNADRTATITLSYTGAQNKTVTVTQGHYVADYATLPFSFDDGKADIEETAGLTETGLGTDYGSSPKLKFDTTGDELILKINERPGVLTFDVKGNPGGTPSAWIGTFTIQASADGTSYSDVVSYDNLASTKESKTVNNLPADARYIKFVYDKTQGNVALGNINLAAYVAPANYNLTVTLDDNISAIYIYDAADQTEALIEDGAAGTVQVTNGTEILVSPDVAAGYQLATLMVDGNDVTSQIDGSGAYTFTMPSHAVTITATATQNSVTPTPSTGGKWIQTDLANLTNKDIFVIVGDNGAAYALPNDGGTTTPSAVSVTIDNNTLSGDPAANIQWNLSGNATDGYTFYPNGDNEKWLYCTNTNKGVCVGTNDENKLFIFEDEYLYNTATSRYVGIYNSQDWRCYTLTNEGNFPTNIVGQTFSFYKQVESVKLNDSYGYATYASTNPLNFTDYETAGYSAWAVESISGTTITFTQITGVVPAGTGMLLMGTAGATINLNVSNTAGSAITNLLEGITSDKTVAAGEYYGLSGNQFVKVNAGTVKAGKALLPASALGGSSVKAFTFVFEDDATGISLMEDGRSQMEDGAIYNVAGQRLNKMQKGINIVNGKKIAVK